jgi:hypothetical protein
VAGCSIYLCFPQDRYVPGMRGWVTEATQAVRARPEWATCSVRQIEYDHSMSLRVTDLCSEVFSRIGPVILISPVQERVITLLRERLTSRTTVLVAEDAFSADAIIEQLGRAKLMHDSGEPHVCRQFVVALLLLRKLDQERMWTGNAKGYMWVDDIRKGRGLDEQFVDAIPAVLSVLLQHDLLVQKRSRNSNKYGLNPNRREEIYATLRERRFGSPQLSAVLHRDRSVVSVRHLDLLDCYTNPPERGG